ncbi:hypothetical protein KRP22_005013 [Phytophthora ramorum]|uniref:uncharacterized protein n=1 Tax=Phytophthora ramorum TaxID=164328 RepID=UPI0030B6FC64|nr:hypothetical protein KRP23_13610 [Phytophthora ramorum]KAH7497534.1 hypothetical protein KRP22_12597 [Phytophthora ramorum]
MVVRNFFEDTAEPMLAEPAKASISTADDCSASLGRACSANVVDTSGLFDSVNGDRALATVKQYKEITGYTPGKAAQSALSSNNFGVGTIPGAADA